MTIPLNTIPGKIKHTLQAKFRQRVSFDTAERLLYSHDLACPPALVRPLIMRSVAGGIVQPQDEEELGYLLKLANQHKIPLTPRGRGTSGYGGAIPRFGGLVVDFSRMNRILEIDPRNLSATTEPGVIWLDLERELAAKGLALRLYPGSAPASTVGGWLAQGGSGFGSYAYGWFGENIISARVVQPDGKTVTYTADELDLIRDAEGITGFITRTCLKVKPAEMLEPLVASFETPDQLADMFRNVVECKLKLWSVSFINPFMGELRNKLRRQAGVAMARPGETYLAIFVFPGAESKLKGELKRLICSHNGRLLGGMPSKRLWAERFEILKIKSIAPSLISTKVALPLESLEAVLKQSGKIKQPLAIEGVLLRDGSGSAKAVLLGFIPHDEQKAGYNLAYGLSLSFIKLAEKMGGKPCTTGIYFRHHAARIIGRHRLIRLIHKKRAIDPHNILNPGKIIGTDALEKFMKAAWNLEPLIRLMANHSRLPVGHKPDADSPDITSWQAYSCDQCGFCITNCPNYHGWETQGPRGRWYLLRLVLQGRLGLDEIKRIFRPCNGCKECHLACPQGLPAITPELLNSL
jgi:FAD/FMN-containing dehydrogenase/NAD-dependent dihydropyrimidine dehydrogenase PreA subunit